MKPNIGISDKALKRNSVTLSIVLASEMTLYIKTRKAHWNISGESFMEFHMHYEAQYTELEKSIDEIAERIGKLGHKTIGTMVEYLKLSIIKEHPDKYPSSRELLNELLKDHEKIVVFIRNDIEAKDRLDIGTVDFLTGLVEKHETNAWKLRRYLN